MAHKIEWTEKTWNPSAGCTKISSGCKNCYAKTMAIRLQAMGVEGYEKTVLNSIPFQADKVKRNKKMNGKEIDGQVWQQYPNIIEQQYTIIE